MARIKKRPEKMEILVEELKTAEEEVLTAVSDATEVNEVKDKKPVGYSSEVDRKREELIRLSETGDISKTVCYLTKASAKIINRVYNELESARMERATVFLCDQLISKSSAALGGLDAIAKSEEMEKELKNDPLLRKDVESVVSMITPWIPFLGILSGGITVGKRSRRQEGSGRVSERSVR